MNPDALLQPTDNSPMKTQTEELAAVTDALAAFDGLQLAFVFGSVARNTARPDSDIDVAILAGRPLTGQETIELIETLADVTGRPVDLIDLAVAGPLIVGQALQHGCRVWGTPAQQAALAVKNLFDASDFLPYVQRTLAERRQAWTG